MQSASGPVAGITLELGGKSPVVVLADADLDAAAAWCCTGYFLQRRTGLRRRGAPDL